MHNTHTHMQAVTLSLGDEVSEGGAIIGAELLLSALECCGVDNARCVRFGFIYLCIRPFLRHTVCNEETHARP